MKFFLHFLATWTIMDVEASGRQSTTEKGDLPFSTKDEAVASTEKMSDMLETSPVWGQLSEALQAKISEEVAADAEKLAKRFTAEKLYKDEAQRSHAVTLKFQKSFSDKHLRCRHAVDQLNTHDDGACLATDAVGRPVDKQVVLPYRCYTGEKACPPSFHCQELGAAVRSRGRVGMCVHRQKSWKVRGTNMRNKTNQRCVQEFRNVADLCVKEEGAKPIGDAPPKPVFPVRRTTAADGADTCSCGVAVVAAIVVLLLLVAAVGGYAFLRHRAAKKKQEKNGKKQSSSKKKDDSKSLKKKGAVPVMEAQPRRKSSHYYDSNELYTSSDCSDSES